MMTSTNSVASMLIPYDSSMTASKEITLNEVIAIIVSTYGCSIEEALKLIDITNDMSKGAKYAR